MRVAPAVLLVAMVAACANTGDPQKDAALDYMKAEIAFTSAVRGVNAAIQADKIKLDDARRVIGPLVWRGAAILDKLHEQIDAGKKPSVDLISELLQIAAAIVEKRLELEGS